MRDLIHTEEFEGFTISLYREEEDASPAGQFASGDDEADAEILRRIESGDLDWFRAKVTAERAGIELAADYLGACCYESASAFVASGDYYEEMRAIVVEEARAKIAKLV